MSLGGTLKDVCLFFYYLIFDTCLAIVYMVVPRPHKKDLTKETIVITGGGQGLGRSLAERFLKGGANVVLWDINEQQLRKTEQELKAAGHKNVSVYQCDVSKSEAVYAAAARVKKEVGVVTMLVNNAGVVSGKLITDLTDEQIDRTLRVNVLAHFWTVKAFLPDMLTGGRGHIVNVASLAGMMCPTPRLTDYACSKFAAVGFDEGLRYEMKECYGDVVKCTVLCPYFINTGMFSNVQSDNIVFSMLDQEDTTRRMYEAIMSEQEVLILPGHASIFVILRSVIPVRATAYIARIFGANEAMATWTGHAKKE